MSRYRRAIAAGSSYFFTAVTYVNRSCAAKRFARRCALRHIDYLHFNPVKHGHVQYVADWPYSTFHRYVRDGVYERDWAGVMDGEVMGYD